MEKPVKRKDFSKADPEIRPLLQDEHFTPQPYIDKIQKSAVNILCFSFSWSAETAMKVEHFTPQFEHFTPLVEHFTPQFEHFTPQK